jgi:hypothetical protein
MRGFYGNPDAARMGFWEIPEKYRAINAKTPERKKGRNGSPCGKIYRVSAA